MRLPRLLISAMQKKLGMMYDVLGTAYYRGRISWEFDDSRTLTEYCLRLVLKENHVKVAYWYRKAAEQGVASAQYMLGEMFDHGQGVPQDYAQAAVWMCKAAEQGVVDAQCCLSWMYDNGHGVQQDYEQSAYWYRKAAEQGDASAQYKLGNAYAHGDGVPQDYAKAFFWLDLAALGDASRYLIEEGDAKKYRDEVAAHLSPADLPRVLVWVRKWSESHPAKPDTQ
jgi:hypothetical protein